jgi:predicted ribosome quality control (RQC) complex YloA/Tae2 family protein
MNIYYYKKWVDEFRFKTLSFDTMKYNDELYTIVFKEKKANICIYFGSIDTFLFFNENHNHDDEQSTQNDKNSLTKNINFHLNHSILDRCDLYNNDKIICFTFSKWNIYNQKEKYFLIFEMINRYQNLILARYENEKMIILDCQKKISFTDSTTRQILPGSEYTPPQTNFVHTTENVKYPLIIEKKEYFNMNDYFISFYTDVVLEKKLITMKNSIINEVKKEYNKNIKKLSKQKEELMIANEIDHWYHCVELLKSSIHEIKQGQTEIILKNYFLPCQKENNEEIFQDIIIKIDPKLSPIKNLEYYAKKYKKAYSGQKIIQENIKKSEYEIEQNNKLIERITAINNYAEIKTYKEKNIKTKLYEDKKLFRSIKINDEWDILIGRSNTENDILTCKTAKPNDWWFHSRIFHGTHVVLRNYQKKNPPENLITICSRLAAYYSSAKNSQNVPVDYTQIRYVRKPRASAKGFVVYTNQKTIYVNPISFRDAIEMLKIKH